MKGTKMSHVNSVLNYFTVGRGDEPEHRLRVTGGRAGSGQGWALRHVPAVRRVLAGQQGWAGDHRVLRIGQIYGLQLSHLLRVSPGYVISPLWSSLSCKTGREHGAWECKVAW